LLGLTENDVAGNQLNSIVQAAFVAAYEELLDPAVITVGEWSVASRFTNNEPRTTGISAPVTAVQATDNIVDSQRRRLPGRGT
jgi:hypothetical protein